MKRSADFRVVFAWLTIALLSESTIAGFSSENDAEDGFVFQPGIHEDPQPATGALQRNRYLLYEVNHVEGFNLRRDVYMRMASLVLKLGPEWTLVLPPWGPLYHWRSRELGPQARIPWGAFFDLPSLDRHVRVMEFQDYLRERDSIDMVYYLQYFEDTFEEGNRWAEKYEEGRCLESPPYQSDEGQKVKGWFWGYDHVFATNFTCVSLQGQVSTFLPLLLSTNYGSVMLDRAETVLHDSFGDETYWKARRSMRFAKNLRSIGDEFRQKFLNSTDSTDGTILNEDWRNTKKGQKRAEGGPYLGVHLRRQDFLRGRAEHLPSLAKAAEKIESLLRKLDLSLAYVATDAPKKEFEELESHLGEMSKCFRFSPSAEEKKLLMDGGVAIVDQWIAAHARYFIGSHESTFTFRIQEEREIMGFPSETTFNRFCGDVEDPCEAPSKWTIVY